MTWPPFTWKAPKFKYQSLRSKPRTFRVIKLLPPTRSFLPPFKQILNIKIREISLDEGAGQYDTLSYCWGTGAADRPVAVLQSGDDRSSGGYQTIHISASLEAALLSLSREGDGEAHRHIFADQISINQSDNAEKIEQVRLMGEIYARSARVVVWLGEDTAETRLFFDFSTRLSSEGILSRAMGPNVGHYMNVFDAIMNSSIELETEAEKEDRNDILDLIARYGPQFPLSGLADILRRSWANRLWTVQEGCLPPKVVFRSGQNSLCYDCVRGSLLFHSVWTTYWMRMRKGSVSKEDIRARSRIYDLTQSFHRINRERKAIHVTRGRRRCLYDVVAQYNVNENRPKIGATKAEDRIYALLGLADNNEIARETVEKMEIDNPKDTFANFAATVIKSNVDVLLFSQTPKSPTLGHKLPSWVPDWSADPLRTPYGYSDLATPVFSAGGPRAGHNMAVDAMRGALRVVAVPVGRVARVGVRSIRPDENSTLESAEYMSVRYLFEEVGEFVEMAAEINRAHAPDISDEQRRLESIIRISDGGLSMRQFPVQFDSTTAYAVLKDVHENVSRWGRRLIDVSAQTQSMSSFTGVVRSTGIMPWYWTPASEVDVTRLCAIDPVAAIKIWAEGLCSLASDVWWVVWYVAKIRLLTTILRIRRRWVRIGVHDSDHNEALRNVGLKSELLWSQEWELYTSNLLKNANRKLFLTDTGYVGLGPCNMEANDIIVVIPGGSVPHVLRHHTMQGTPGDCYSDEMVSSWLYVGEAYCDGVMDGELVAGEGNEARNFEIV